MPIHGAGDRAWHWHLVGAELRERGHDVVAVDLPSEDESAGLSEYADTVVEGGQNQLVRLDIIKLGERLATCSASLRHSAAQDAGEQPEQRFAADVTRRGQVDGNGLGSAVELQQQLAMRF